jgi:alginate O-acetyltransferase complex protein AlgI
MVFSSTTFLFLFLPAIIILYFLSPKKIIFRNSLLLFASLFFYSWGEGSYIIVMIVSIIINYVVGRLIFSNLDNNRKKAKLYLAIGITLNLAILFHFKYINFAVDIINSAILLLGSNHFLGLEKPVHLPLGISFFTFQAISYIVDVYRKQASVRSNPINLALYISLFPQLIAGPIVRYSTIADQITNRKTSLDDFSCGVQRFIIGLGKKVIIANNLGYVVDEIFLNNPGDLSSGLIWCAMLLYGLQIFYDFSGYSDMAIGLGRMFGFKFLENFNYPYASKSLREFWQKWHISLSSWFRDYLYIPLGGNKKGAGRTYLNLFIVFFLCGLWHGASFNFMLWGLFHGLFLTLERVRLVKINLEKIQNNIPKFLSKTLAHTYLIFIITISWVFFRFENIEDALLVTKSMILFKENHEVGMELLLAHKIIFFVLPVAILLAIPTKITAIKSMLTKTSNHNLLNTALAIFLISILVLSIIAVGSGSYNPFIYFKF